MFCSLNEWAFISTSAKNRAFQHHDRYVQKIKKEKQLKKEGIEGSKLRRRVAEAACKSGTLRALDVTANGQHCERWVEARMRGGCDGRASLTECVFPCAKQNRALSNLVLSYRPL